jgi:hypothetical protein
MAIQLLDRSIKLPTSSAEIRSRFDHDQWLMTDAERSALSALLCELRPESAIEIGTYRTGSLSVISKFSKQVYTLDIDPIFRDTYGEIFPDVQFIVGDSGETLPPLLEKIQRSDEPLGFILIDAATSENGVRRDIENLLRYIPIRPLYIIIHNSFHPDCRKGILTANWSSNPHAHMVELDYIVGRFISKDEGDKYRQMWCGFALAILLPEPRDGNVLIHQNEGLIFKKAYWHSIYPYQKVKNLVLMQKLKSKGGKYLKRCFSRVYDWLKIR